MLEVLKALLWGGPWYLTRHVILVHQHLLSLSLLLRLGLSLCLLID
jgi:hypothetical protein